MSITRASLLGDSYSNKSSGTIPVRGIIMWSGSIADIPTGWHLCDGNNGTPNLTDRFIVGAGGIYGVNDTGGTNTVILSNEQMPFHSHPYAFAQGSNGAINNGYNQITNVNKIQDVSELEQTGPSDGQRLSAYTANTAISGSGQAHENRPPYWALAFIMRLQ